MNNNLWWSFDPDSRSFSALPPGPALLPALGIFALIGAIQAVRNIDWLESKPSRAFRDLEFYKQDESRYHALLQKRIDFIKGRGEDWDFRDFNEFNKLKYPAWNQGKSWNWRR